MEAQQRVTRLARCWFLGHFGQEASPLGLFVLTAYGATRGRSASQLDLGGERVPARGEGEVHMVSSGAQ